MPSPIHTTTRGKNIDHMIKMRGSRTNSMSDEEPMASKKPNRKKKTASKTKRSTINMPSPKKTAVDSLTEKTFNQSASKKDTASTLDPTKPTDVSNVNVPQKKKQKKNAITSTLGPRRNPKCRTVWMKILVIAMSLILRLWRLMSQLMYATGHKQLYASFLN